jgi:hypothetical protein
MWATPSVQEIIFNPIILQWLPVVNVIKRAHSETWGASRHRNTNWPIKFSCKKKKNSQTWLQQSSLDLFRDSPGWREDSMWLRRGNLQNPDYGNHRTFT